MKDQRDVRGRRISGAAGDKSCINDTYALIDSGTGRPLASLISYPGSAEKTRQTPSSHPTSSAPSIAMQFSPSFKDSHPPHEVISVWVSIHSCPLALTEMGQAVS